MMSTRRSFLYAIGASGIAPRFRTLAGETVELVGRNVLPQWRDFYVWETVSPEGRPEVFRILPPPFPPEMLLLAAGVYFNPEAPVNDVRECCRWWELRLRLAARDIFIAPLASLAGAGSLREFANPVRVRDSDSFEVLLNCEAFHTEAPITVQTVFHGLVRTNNPQQL